MAFVRSFTDYFPEPLNHPWTTVLVRESPSSLGPWTDAAQIDTLTYNPGGEYLTEQAAIESGGWYQLVFVDSTGDRQPTDPVFYGPSYTPTLEEVAALIRHRMYVGGVRERTFTAQTAVTAEEARDELAWAATEVAGVLGNVTGDQLPFARSLTALRAAIRIARSLPATDGDDANLEQLVADYNATLVRIQAAQAVGEVPGVGGTNKIQSVPMTQPFDFVPLILP